jgi:transposase InsO family protein
VYPVLNKDVLTQAEVLIALRTIAPQDRDAIDAWIRVHGTPEQRDELMASLPSLPIGTAWFWSPGWLDVFCRLQIRRKETYDSSATPKVGTVRREPKTLAAVDLERLRTRLAGVIERMKEEDPRELRRRIAELEGAHKPHIVVERVEVPVLPPEQIAQLQELVTGLRAVADALVAALANLGYTISDQTVGNILKRHGLPPAPQRKTTTTWKEFIRTHLDVLVATDFFTAEVWTLSGLVTYYVLFFIRLGTREVHVAGVTPHPNHAWMRQIARNITMEPWGFLASGQYLIHDRDGKYGPAFHQIIDAAGVTRVPLPPRSPNLNAYAERWVRSVKEECLARMILFGEASLRHVLRPYVEHFHAERNHQGKSHVLLFPAVSQDPTREGPIQCRERLGRLLKYYALEVA